MDGGKEAHTIYEVLATFMSDTGWHPPFSSVFMTFISLFRRGFIAASAAYHRQDPAKMLTCLLYSIHYIYRLLVGHLACGVALQGIWMLKLQVAWQDTPDPGAHGQCRAPGMPCALS